MLDPDFLLSLPPIEAQYEYTRRDTILYALGIGAEALPFVYEEGLFALPTMATVMAYPGFFWRDPKYGVDWRRVLHGENALQIHRPLPVEGKLSSVTTLGPIFDKGRDRGAVCYQTRRIYNDEGDLLATIGVGTFFRGDGGFGGNSEGQPKPVAIPDRAPDLSHTLYTSSNQALLYRLSGDLNPLHIDPEVASSAGFEKPILHGLASYGVASRSAIAALCGNDPTRLHRFDARFTSVVYPGETIKTDFWLDGAGRALFRSTVVERSVVAMNNGLVEYS